MNKRLLLLWISALFLLAGTALAACGDDDDDDGGGGGTDTTAAELETLEPGTLMVGSDIPYAAVRVRRPPDYEGFDVDLVNEIAKRLGLEVEFVKTPFDTIFRDLAQDKFDWSRSSTDDHRRAREGGRLLGPLLRAEQSLLVKKGSDIQTVDDLDGQDRSACRSGTTGEDYAKDNADAEDRAHLRPDRRRVQRARQPGQVDAVIYRLPGLEVGRRAVEAGPRGRASPINTGEYFGLAFAEGERRAPRGGQRGPRRDEDGRDVRRDLQEVVRASSRPRQSLEQDEHAQVVRRLAAPR